MADNIELDAGTGGATIAADDISSVWYQIVKMAFGALDTATLVTTSNPLPVDIRAENASVTVDNAGTFAVQEDGDALTALQLIDNLVLAEDAAHQTADPGVQMLAVRKATPADLSGTDGDYEPLQMDNGRLWTSTTVDAALPAGDNNIGNVDIASGTVTAELSAVDNAVLDTIDAVLDTIKVDTEAIETAVEAIQAGQLADGHNVTIDNSTGAAAVNIQDGGNSITIDGTVTAELSATDNAVLDSIQTAVEVIDNAISGSEMQVDVVAALPAGDNNIGNVDIASAIPAGTNNIGDVDVASIAAGSNLIGNVGVGVRTSGGMTIFRSIDIDESEEEVKGSAGQLYSISAFNTTAAPLYLKFYNLTAANTTVGSSTPVLTFVVPGNADSDGAGFVWNNDIGFAFGTAITVACTTGVADNDTGAPGANACIVNIGYA